MVGAGLGGLAAACTLAARGGAGRRRRAIDHAAGGRSQRGCAHGSDRVHEKIAGDLEQVNPLWCGGYNGTLGLDQQGVGVASDLTSGRCKIKCATGGNGGCSIGDREVRD